MALKNYTSTVDPLKTAGEIEFILIKHGAKSIHKDINDGGEISNLSFDVVTPYGPMQIKLPVNVEPVLNVLTREKKKNSSVKATREQAERTAWRNIKDWVDAQMALLEVDMVKMEQIFLPYAVLGDSGQTVFEKLESNKFLLK